MNRAQSFEGLHHISRATNAGLQSVHFLTTNASRSRSPLDFDSNVSAIEVFAADDDEYL